MKTTRTTKMAIYSRCFSFLLVIFAALDASESMFEEKEIIDKTPLIIHVVTGTTAVLPCKVRAEYTERFPDDYKVLWVSPLETAISIQDRRIINDMRMSVERPFNQDWNLHIRNVSLTDAGPYKCQINTNPVGTKRVDLVVQEPPSIVAHTVPLDVQKPEGEYVEIFCNVSGYPEPNVTWFRLNPHTHGRREKVGQQGESLIIRNISRMCADKYQCVADNGIPPAITQTFTVVVLFAPEVSLPNHRLGQYLGRDTILECDIKASPLNQAEWEFKGMPLTNDFYHELNVYKNTAEDITTLSLRIRELKPRDYGRYFCKARNSLGQVSDSMELYEIKPKTTTTTTSTTTSTEHPWTRKPWVNKRPTGEVVQIHGTDVTNARKNQYKNKNKHNKNRPLPSRGGQEKEQGQSMGVISENSNGGQNAATNLQNLMDLRLVWTLSTTALVASLHLAR